MSAGWSGCCRKSGLCGNCRSRLFPLRLRRNSQTVDGRRLSLRSRHIRTRRSNCSAGISAIAHGSASAAGSSKTPEEEHFPLKIHKIRKPGEFPVFLRPQAGGADDADLIPGGTCAFQEKGAERIQCFCVIAYADVCGTDDILMEAIKKTIGSIQFSVRRDGFRRLTIPKNRTIICALAAGSTPHMEEV